MKSLQTGLIAALVIAGAVMYWIQHQAQEKLRTDIATLAAQNDSLKADTENLANQLAQATNSQSMGKEQLSELLKLRGEVGQLRRQAGDVVKLREENQRLQAVPVAAPPQPAAPDAEEQEKQFTIQKLTNAKQGMLAFIMFANDNNNLLPTNAAAASRYLNDDPSQVETNFDIVYQGSVNSIADPATTIVLKGKPWQSLDGRWKKAYGFADGHAEIHAEPNGNFDEWESHHIASPPAPANQ
jgi:outer membrane murein-binding lipoprotein Lpp